ncbi:HotDog domain-containing protein [Cryomyces antarcticus]
MAPSSDASFFEAIPWCARLLADPNMAVTSWSSREAKDDGEDTCFSETLKTARTIDKSIAFYRKRASENSRVEESYMLLSLGSGLDGHAGLLHGGIISTIVDEGTGFLLQANVGGREEMTTLYTVALNVSYTKPVRTPSVVLVSAEWLEWKGRKANIRATIRDATGSVLAVGDALFVQARERL